MPLTLLTLPSSASVTATPSLQAPSPFFPTPSNPPGVLLNISEGKNEGEEGECEGWRVLICRDLGRGSWERDWKVDRGVRGSGEVAGGERGVGGACLLSALSWS